jgi:hypothetical protein
MPLNAQKQEKDLTGKQTQSSFGKSIRKALGTRIGTLIDWREGSAKSGKISGRYGHAFRDGR